MTVFHSPLFKINNDSVPILLYFQLQKKLFLFFLNVLRFRLKLQFNHVLLSNLHNVHFAATSSAEWSVWIRFKVKRAQAEPERWAQETRWHLLSMKKMSCALPRLLTSPTVWHEMFAGSNFLRFLQFYPQSAKLKSVSQKFSRQKCTPLAKLYKQNPHVESCWCHFFKTSQLIIKDEIGHGPWQSLPLTELNRNLLAPDLQVWRNAS